MKVGSCDPGCCTPSYTHIHAHTRTCTGLTLGLASSVLTACVKGHVSCLGGVALYEERALRRSLALWPGRQGLCLPPFP